jgi:putative transposase
MRNYPIDLLHIDTGLPSRREAFGKQLCAALSYAPEIMIEEGQGLPSLWTDLQQQLYLGSDAFIERLQSRLPEENAVSAVPKVQRRIIRSLPWYKHQHSNPKVAMVRAYESGAYTLAQIARYFGVHYITVR